MRGRCGVAGRIAQTLAYRTVNCMDHGTCSDLPASIFSMKRKNEKQKIETTSCTAGCVNSRKIGRSSNSNGIVCTPRTPITTLFYVLILLLMSLSDKNISHRSYSAVVSSGTCQGQVRGQASAALHAAARAKVKIGAGHEGVSDALSP